MIRFFLISIFMAASAFSAPGHEHARANKFSARLTVGGGAYGSVIDNTANRNAADSARKIIKNGKEIGESPVSDYSKYLSLGWLVPLQLEAAYALTDTYELLFGFQSIFSGDLYGENKYAMKEFGIALGHRYFFNPRESIQAYVSGQLALNLTEFTHVEGRSAFGLMFKITPEIGLFSEPFMTLAFLYDSDDKVGKGVQLGAGVATGLQYIF